MSPGKKRAIYFRLKLLGEKNSESAESYHDVVDTEYDLRDYDVAVELYKRILDIRTKLFGKEHSKTDESYLDLEDAQDALEKYISTVESVWRLTVNYENQAWRKAREN